MDSFSKRYGFGRAEVKTTVKNETSPAIRNAVVQVAYQCGLKPSDLRTLLCAILFCEPNKNNWSEFPDVDNEVFDLIEKCEWYEIYDFIENIARLRRYSDYFADELNRFFKRVGVEWRLVGECVERPD